MAYDPGIPTGLVDLDVDYLAIQQNFTQLDTTFGIDHVTYSNTSPQNGYHKDLHFNPVSTTATNAPNNYVTATQYPQGVPATVAGIGQLFSSQVNDAKSTDTGLFWLSGNGLKVAMTRNLAPVAATNGYTFLPGGLIIQWGKVIQALPGGSSGSVTFATNNIAFPTSCFAVFTSILHTANPTSANAGTVSVNTGFSSTSFSWRCQTTSGQYTGFTWYAIGM